MKNLYPTELVTNIRLKNITPFVGSGYSVPSGLPTWNQLIMELLGELSDEFDIVEVGKLYEEGILDNLTASEIYNIINKSEFKLKRILKNRIDRPLDSNAFHDCLYKFRFDSIITTNFDKLIENHYLKCGTLINKIWKNEQLAFFEDKRITQLIKIHGTIEDPNSIVLGLSDYKNYINDNKALYTVLSSFFLTRSILFLGFSLQDPHILNLLEELKINSSSNIRNHYVVLFKPTKEEVNRIRSLGIKIINLDGDEIFKANLDWMEGLLERSRIIGKSNLDKSILINQALKEELDDSAPQSTIRMRANLGILSNPKNVSFQENIYGSLDQDSLEIEMGNLAREFLSQNNRNRIKCILYINPLHSLDKGYSRSSVIARLNAISDFLKDFPEQIDLVQSIYPVDLNHIILGERCSLITLQGAKEIGYDRILRKDNRWVVLSEMEVFDYDFDALRHNNRVVANLIGINVEQENWAILLFNELILRSISSISKPVSVALISHNDGFEVVDRKLVHDQGILHYSVHLHIINSATDRILIQRRSKTKDLLASMFDVSVSGHPESIDFKNELLREVAEELTIWIDASRLKYAFDRKRNIGEDNEIVKVYYVSINEFESEKINKFNNSEIESIYWIDVKDILANNFTSGKGYIMVNSISIPVKSQLSKNEFAVGSLLEMSEVIEFYKKTEKNV